MSRARVILITLATWLAGCAYAAHHHVTTILASSDAGHGYERDPRFLLFMFTVFRLPFWVLALFVVLACEFVMLKPGPGRLR